MPTLVLMPMPMPMPMPMRATSLCDQTIAASCSLILSACLFWRCAYVTDRQKKKVVVTATKKADSEAGSTD
jgi:hypothetical protein